MSVVKSIQSIALMNTTTPIIGEVYFLTEKHISGNFIVKLLDSSMIVDNSIIIGSANPTMIFERIIENNIDCRWFGARSDANNYVCTIGQNSDIVNFQNAFLDNTYIGLKIQIFAAGKNNYSQQATILEIINVTSCRISLPAEIACILVPCIIGTNSKNGILKAIDYCSKLKITGIRISGNYLIGNENDGLMIDEHFLNLQKSDFIYDFSYSTIYGCVMINNEITNPQARNVFVKNLNVYALGDNFSILGNNNWNGVAISEGYSCSFENITVFANGGVRGFSIQSENLYGGIHQLQVQNYRFLGQSFWQNTDGFDISGIGINTISNLQINNVSITNSGRGFYCNCISSSNSFQNIQVNNVFISNCFKQTLRIIRVISSSFNNLFLEKSDISDSDVPVVEIDKSTVAINSISINNKCNLTSYILVVSDGQDSTLSNIRLVNSSSTKTNVGILLFSNNLIIDNLYIENVIMGFYKAGFKTIVRNFTYKNITDPLRNNTADDTLMIEGGTYINGQYPTKAEFSGFLAQAMCLFDGNLPNPIGIITPFRSANIMEIEKLGVGKYVIKFKYNLKDIPILGSISSYANSTTLFPILIESNTNVSMATIHLKDLSGNFSDGNFISLIFF